MIACKNGEATIGESVRSAVSQADVYVVSDGSDDRTAEVASAAGARVHSRRIGRGKPDALRAGIGVFRLESRYQYIAVLDDDTILEPDYVAKLEEALDRDLGIAAASGRIDTRWDDSRRWNVFLAIRAFMYWSYQCTIKRGQNALHVVNVICGANTVFRSAIFASLVRQSTPYAIDDMFWLAEIVRRRLGRVAYIHGARSWTIDPHTFRDWYRQTVRWSWGQFQSIRGHRLGLTPVRRARPGSRGLRPSGFDIAYLLLLVDWLAYMLEPFLLVPVAFFLRGFFDPLWFGVFYAATSYAWIAAAAIALRKPRLLVLAPALMALDAVYRVTMLHALTKTILRPRIDTCAWESPKRFELSTEPAVPAA